MIGQKRREMFTVCRSVSCRRTGMKAGSKFQPLRQVVNEWSTIFGKCLIVTTSGI